MVAWSEDKLSRKPVADAFEKIALSYTSEKVFLVSAEFGMGKTFFVQNWATQLKEKGYPVVIFDAWRNDYLESPLAGFVSSLREQVPQSDTASETKDRITQIAKVAAPVILKTGVRVGLRALTLGAVEGDVDSIKEILVEEGISGAEDLSHETLEAFSNVSSQLKFHHDVQTTYSEAITSILEESDGDQLFVLVDELDRCRPDFSIELLESIKHFLGVAKVSYFIFCDDDVLESQAAMIFGSRTAGEKYISKFYNQKLRLPTGGKLEFAQSYANHLSQEIEGQIWDVHGSRVSHLVDMIGSSNLTIRQIKRCVDFASNLYTVSDRAKNAWPFCNAFLLLRLGEPERYKELLRDGVTSVALPSAPMSDWADINRAISTFLGKATIDNDTLLHWRQTDSGEEGRYLHLFECLGGNRRSTLAQKKLSLIEHLESFGAILGR